MSNPIPNPEVYKLLSTPEADHLAELYLIQADLNAAYDTLKLYFDKYAANTLPKEGRAAIISPSLFRDGILLFCSCFSAKDANKLDTTAVYGPSGEDQVAYAKKILDLRDSFVAHNFGPQRQHSIVIVCHKNDGGIQPLGFSQNFIRFSGWASGEGDRLLPFIDKAREHLKARIEVAEALVMQQVSAISREELEALPELELAIPRPEDYRLSRSRFRESGRGWRSPVPQRRLGPTTVTGP